MKFVRISEEFELSEFELRGVNYYKMYYQIQGKLDLVRVSGGGGGGFDSSEFELAGFYCISLAFQLDRSEEISFLHTITNLNLVFIRVCLNLAGWEVVFVNFAS